MKNKILIGILLFLTLLSVNPTWAQQWSGSTNADHNISRTGNVGIGEPNPNLRLHVNGGDGLSLGMGGNGTGEGFGCKRTAGGNQYGLDFYTSSINRMAITRNGNVGIGTSAPSKKLQVVGGLRVENEVSVGGAYVFEVDAPNILGGRFKIAANGNVGIGTSNPTFKLAVNGTIRAMEIRVETGWADHVFGENFRLRPLSEVEQFVRENKHLPDVTPAAEIQADGLQVGKVMTEMMQKIEELTLYVIELKKDNDAMRVYLNTLEKSKK